MGEGRVGARHGAGRLRLPRAQEGAREPRVDSGEMSILRITRKKQTNRSISFLKSKKGHPSTDILKVESLCLLEV